MRRLVLCVWLSLVVLIPLPWSAPQAQEAPQDPKARPLPQGLPQRELSEKERKKREERLRKELEGHYRKWLDEDVVYIILPEEKTAFLHLNTEEERELFVEQLWLRRDPTPDTVENEYKQEHFRRIAYANERFTAGRPGWMTDRGRIYIIHGSPDQVESYPAGAVYNELPQEGRGRMVIYAMERWRYRYLEGIGSDITLEFVDKNGDADHRLMMDPTEKEVFLSPGPLTRATEPLFWPSGQEGAGARTSQFQQLERMNLYSRVQRPPEVKFKDLEALVETRISFNLLPFDLRVDYIRVTDQAILVPLTVALQKKNLTFQAQDGVHHAVVNVFGRVTTPGGRAVQAFEDVIQIDLPAALFANVVNQPSLYQKAIPLRPGLYKLNLVLKDLNSGNIGTVEQRLTVPHFPEDQLTHSSLILADLIERVPSKNVGAGQFVIGDTKVRPAVGEQFRPDERMGIYLQVYNLGIDPRTGKPEAAIDYRIHKGEKTVFHYSETTRNLERAGQQLTLEKRLSLEGLQPGDYELEITIADRVRGQTIKPSAKFRVLPP